MWSRSGEHGRLGSLKAVSVMCVFGPSLFGYTHLTIDVKAIVITLKFDPLIFNICNIFSYQSILIKQFSHIVGQGLIISFYCLKQTISHLFKLRIRFQEI